MSLVELSLKGFVDEVESSSPAPGGGSVAAYAGAQGFALMAMVCRLTVGREKFKAVKEEVSALMQTAEKRMETLLALVDEDTQGFYGVMDALGLPKSTEEEKAARREALELATIKAAEIPQKTASLCLEGLEKIPVLLAKGNPNALSDLGVAALMLESGLEGALYNIQINAQGLKTEERAQQFRSTVFQMRADGKKLSLNIKEQVYKGLN
ncbi:cyclodeaminase/cyclohydrolase family protein [Desulfosporosinus sp. OT]|uniref:cyclodeaminase/cyclohydrolase family protein n=1 Tax=Desulfosporosinus sp. OT TaxID=913865 RepID=UPI000223A191|nr:cyclodeaminase/cyclohydrolase family protein [Desulfosporosinus sp. OT]EGW38501.1 formiminotransferase-cyclodeaminase family protein [Desulfosporosinus sp. OT]